MFLEWTQITEELVLVATEARAWMHRPAQCLGADPFAEPMTGRGSTATTRRLLDGAVALSQRAVLARAPGPPLTREGYVERLVAHYYTTHWSAWQLRRAATRFQEGNRPELARLAESLARHEQCHDQLAIRDLEALGYPSEYASRAPMGMQTSALLHYALRCLGGAHPVTLLGYGYALQRAAGAVTADYLLAVQSLLPPGVNATRCVRAHSALVGPSEHLERLVQGITDLPADDRARVIRAAYDTTKLMFTLQEAARPRPARPGASAARPRPNHTQDVSEYAEAGEVVALASR